MIENNLILICLLGIYDPIRPSVKKAIAQCKNASIKVRMVTGDNIVTALAVCKESGIINTNINLQEALDKKMVINGNDFAKLSDQEIDDML